MEKDKLLTTGNILKLAAITVIAVGAAAVNSVCRDLEQVGRDLPSPVALPKGGK